MKYYRRKYAAYPVYEWLETGILLCLAGGFLDAYTYVTRGGVFANAQTANLILMTLGLATGKGAQALKYLVPILFFFCGVTLSELALHAGKKRRSDFRAHAPVLAGEAAALVLIGALPAAADDTLVNALASFAAALQFDNFRKLEGNPFATAFCTGNLRSATEHLFHAAAEKSRAALKVSGKYFACILAFLAGVVAGYFASRTLGGSAAFLDAGLLALAAAGVACGAFFRKRRVRVRRIAAGELAQARALVWESFERYVAPSYTPEGAEHFRYFLDDPALPAEKDLYGVFAGGMLKGVLIAEKDGSHICAFFVKNGELRQGYGSKLMHRFLEYVPQKSVTVNAAPAAVNAYKKLGFVPEGGICHADGMTYLPMRRDPSPRTEHKPTGGTS